MNIKENYLKELLNSIPVVKNFDIEIVDVTSSSVLIKSPLSTHINYEGTAFGGSINTSCVLASYLLVHHVMRENKIDINSLVIQNSSINYLKPVTSDFYTRATVSEGRVRSYLKMLEKKSIARIEVSSSVSIEEGSKAESSRLIDFNARFVGTKP